MYEYELNLAIEAARAAGEFLKKRERKIGRAHV